MSEIFLALAIITVLFFVLLTLKELMGKKLKEKLCVICAAVTLTWISLLALYRLGLFNNTLIVALLLGQTSLGVFYLVEKKVKEELKIFRLPFLLTLILIAYSLLVLPGDLIRNIILLLTLWVVFSLIYIFRKSENLSSLVKKMVECCKNW